jgi:hypothetical protein
MALSSGTRIGPYEVVASIGAGGMGEVYRARDTSLGRDVALKVLPESVANDPDRLARFEREARTLAALNHPHIAQIHGFENSGGTQALVMEYVDGPTLAERIAHGALPVDDAIAIARQIAEGLEAAHGQGIVHRDLKPANIKVRPDGTVKVLDFGLAKALDSAHGSGLTAQGSVASSPTITSPAMTGLGVILGTAAYMSPEQAKGRPADQQSDIWAFGCVLYEMLTGHRPFQGEDVADTMAAVLRGEPDWGALPAGLPPGTRLVLRRTLARDRRERLRHIGDARLLLDDLGAATVADVRPRHREWLAWGLAALLLASLVGRGLVLRNAPEAVPEVTRFTIQPGEGISLTGAGNQLSAVISPDGRKVVFVASQGGTQAMWIRDLSRSTVDRLAGTERAYYPFWSPDSRSIGFFADRGLKAVNISDGSVRTICPAAAGRGGTWNANGDIVFSGTVVGGLLRVPASGGTPVPATTADSSANSLSHRYPAFLPDGRRFTFLVIPLNQIWLGSLDSTETTMLLPADSQAPVVSDGQVFFVRQGTLFAQPFDLERAVTSGDPVVVQESVLADTAGFHAFSVSENGHLAFRAGQLIQPTQLTWTDHGGRVVGLAGKPDLYRNPSLSADDSRLAVELTDHGRRQQDIWLFELGRNVLSRLTFDEGNEIMPVWSPDGSRIVFASDRTGTPTLYQKAANSSSPEEVLLESRGQPTVPYSWSPDGQYILHRFMNGVFFNTGLLPLSGDRTPRLYAARNYQLANSVVSPDGRLVAYNANDSGRYEVFVESFPTPGARWQVSKDGGVHPRWRPDGREVYYYAPDENLMAAPIASQSTPPVGAAVPLFRARLLTGPTVSVGFLAQYDVTRDARFLLNVPVADPAPPVISVVLNWAAR